MLYVRPTRSEIIDWLREVNQESLAGLYQTADAVRAQHVGSAVHLRALAEISNHCARQCGYCGLRAANSAVQRYRMTAEEILAAARHAVALGYGTIVMQAGEDYGISADFLADIIRQIKRETPLAVTLSMGERPIGDLTLWRDAGADRYLLRFETSDPELYNLIHPPLAGRQSDRIAILRTLRGLGYETGSGIMIGIPGQTYDSIADDIELFHELDLDMIGVGPYIAHPRTPLGSGQWRREIPAADQAPNSEEIVYKVVALTRLVRPDANIPSTTALATINTKNGRELGLSRGANVVMPNLTPLQYRAMYEIYPGKACINETGDQCSACLRHRIAAIGRTIGTGPGGRIARGMCLSTPQSEHGPCAGGNPVSVC